MSFVNYKEAGTTKLAADNETIGPDQVKMPVYKMAWGVEGSASGVDVSYPFPVQVIGTVTAQISLGFAGTLSPTNPMPIQGTVTAQARPLSAVEYVSNPISISQADGFRRVRLLIVHDGNPVTYQLQNEAMGPYVVTLAAAATAGTQETVTFECCARTVGFSSQVKLVSGIN